MVVYTSSQVSLPSNPRNDSPPPNPKPTFSRSKKSKPKKTKSTLNIRTRCSQRVIVGIGIHSAKVCIKTTSYPKKKGKEKAITQQERSPIQPERSSSKTSKPSSNKLSLSKRKKVPLFDKDLKKDFKEKWSTRPIGVGRFIDFAKLEKEKISLKEYSDALGWTKFQEIRERYYPKVIQAFYFRAEVLLEKV
ncbi:hypothetical protein MTR_8g041950 [Medicago truncatula]|uniref:Uncharacterized protein n=1 Tax=Medicago truncatula TaxID=3880 RepID=Q1S5I3_MEDTR|nr:hypothetical protein MtrDRAFT_AC147431g4v2 [Medicago truncatula]AET02531.1 hypothetical protein MTR_8g041950 [Medicago truncatula]